MLEMSIVRNLLSGFMAAGLALASGYCASGHAAEAKRPNIVFILIDDLGWADVGCFGSKYYQTPNIDKLAGRGICRS